MQSIQNRGSIKIKSTALADLVEEMPSFSTKPSSGRMEKRMAKRKALDDTAIKLHKIVPGKSAAPKLADAAAKNEADTVYAELIKDALASTQPWYEDPLGARLARLPGTDASYDTLHTSFLRHKRAESLPADYAFFTKMTLPNAAVAKDIPLGDRLAALSLAVAEGPIVSIKYLKGILSIAASERRREAMSALEVLVDLFTSTALMPQSSHLPATDASLNRGLLGWMVRTGRSIYGDMLRLLEVHAHDCLLHGRETACRFLARLLPVRCSHQDAVISILVNKLGDPEKKLASRVAYYLDVAYGEEVDSIAQVHAAIGRAMASIQNAKEDAGSDGPANSSLTMKDGSKSTVEDKRKNAYRIIYYALTFLTQVKLHADAEVTKQLVTIYGLLFDHFIVHPNNQAVIALSNKKTKPLGKRDRKRQKKQAAHKSSLLHSHEFGRIGKLLLSGLARAIPFLDPADAIISSIVEPLRKLAKTSDNLAIVWQCLGLLFALKQDIHADLLRNMSGGRLLHFKGTHGALFGLLGKLCRSEDCCSDGQTIALLKQAMALFAVGCLYTNPLPLVQETLSIRKSLRASLSLSDEDTASVQCFWELRLLQSHYLPSVVASASDMLSPLHSKKPQEACVEMSPVEWLTAWIDLKDDSQHPDLKFIKAVYRDQKKAVVGETNDVEEEADREIVDDLDDGLEDEIEDSDLDATMDFDEDDLDDGDGFDGGSVFREKSSDEDSDFDNDDDEKWVSK